MRTARPRLPRSIGSVTLMICLLLPAPLVAAEIPAHVWTPALLRNPNAWPHSEQDARIEVAPKGLHVEVADGRTFAIAAASQLILPKELGRIRVRVAESGGGARWFVRLYGALREPGDVRTIGIAQDETANGERILELDPRIRTRGDEPLQLQLGVEGQAGAFAVFEDVAFLPISQQANRLVRKFLQPGQKDIAVTAQPSDLYDAVTGQFLKRNVRDRAGITLSADTAAMVVVAPAGGTLSREGTHTLINGVIVSYR